MGKTVTFQRPDGASISGNLAEPAHPAWAPGVVVIQPDIASAVRWLGSGGAKVGVTGLCMGGAARVALT